MVPSDPSHLSHHSPQTLHPITPSDDSPTNNYHPMSSYSSSNRDIVMPSHDQYPYPEQNSRSFASNGGFSGHNCSLSSFLNLPTVIPDPRPRQSANQRIFDVLCFFTRTKTVTLGLAQAIVGPSLPHDPAHPNQVSILDL